MRRQAQHCDSLFIRRHQRRSSDYHSDDLHFPVRQIWPNGRYRRRCPAGSQTRRCRGQHTGGWVWRSGEIGSWQGDTFKRTGILDGPPSALRTVLTELKIKRKIKR